MPTLTFHTSYEPLSTLGWSSPTVIDARLDGVKVVRATVEWKKLTEDLRVVWYSFFQGRAVDDFQRDKTFTETRLIRDAFSPGCENVLAVDLSSQMLGLAMEELVEQACMLFARDQERLYSGPISRTQERASRGLLANKAWLASIEL